MKYLIINQNTDNYGDDIAALGLNDVIQSVDDSSQIRFLYAPRPWSGTVPLYGDNISHRVMGDLGGKTGYIDILKTWVNSRFGWCFKYKNKEFENFSVDLAWADVVVFSPCGANIGIYKDSNALKLVLQVVAAKRSVIFHFCTVGKSGDIWFDFLAKIALSNSQLYVREARCIEELAQWGMNAQFGPDTAFALPCLSGTKSADGVGENKRIIGIVPTALDWHPHHKESKKFSIVDQLGEEFIRYVAADKNLQIHIIPHLYGHMDETDLLNGVLGSLVSKGISTDQVKIASWVASANDYDLEISQCYVVLTMRYHGVVLSAKNCVPFLALSYESKMNEVCRYTKMQDYCVDVKSSSQDLVTEKIMTLLNNRADIHNKLKESTRLLSAMVRYPIWQTLLGKSTRNSEGDA